MSDPVRRRRGISLCCALAPIAIAPLAGPACGLIADGPPAASRDAGAAPAIDSSVRDAVDPSDAEGAEDAPALPDAHAPAWTAIGGAVVEGPSLTPPSLAAAADGTVYVAFGQSARGQPARDVVERWSGTAWAPLGAIVPTSQLGCAPTLALDAAGTLRLALGYVDTYAPFVSRWSGASWDVEANVVDAGAPTELFYCPTLAAGANGAGAVVYTSIDAPFVLRFAPFGPAASAIASLDDMQHLDGLAATVVGDQIVSARARASTLRLDRWTGAAWEPLGTPFVDEAATDAAGSPIVSRLSMATRSDGALIVAYDRASPLRHELRIVVWQDTVRSVLAGPAAPADARLVGNAIVAVAPNGTPWLAYDTTPSPDGAWNPDAPGTLHVARFDGTSFVDVGELQQALITGFYDFRFGGDGAPYVAMLAARAAGEAALVVARYGP